MIVLNYDQINTINDVLHYGILTYQKISEKSHTNQQQNLFYLMGLKLQIWNISKQK